MRAHSARRPAAAAACQEGIRLSGNMLGGERERKGKNRCRSSVADRRAWNKMSSQDLGMLGCKIPGMVTQHFRVIYLCFGSCRQCVFLGPLSFADSIEQLHHSPASKNQSSAAEPESEGDNLQVL
jgi:hypothetical protein